jgi:hypothetical protein
MNGYTITAVVRAALVVVVCLSLSGCVDVAGALWMARYRAKGGYVREDTEIRRRGDAEVWKRRGDAETRRRGGAVP